MNYNISEDMKIVRELLKITQEELVYTIGVETLTIKRIENGITKTCINSMTRRIMFLSIIIGWFGHISHIIRFIIRTLIFLILDYHS